MRVLLPLPDRDFDPTEVSVPWRALTDVGHEVVFATEAGKAGPVPQCDPLMLSGVVFGKLGALPENVALYRTLENDGAFCAPLAYEEIVPSSFGALVLPGGHAKGMRQYLESTVLVERVRAFFDDKKPVGAICHGGIALVRSGAVKERRMTALPKWMERAAYFLTSWKMGDYYRTYPEYVEDEVRRVNGSMERGPLFSNDYDKPFVVDDATAGASRLITARWPGDAKAFAQKLVDVFRA
jgi:putative intracellular protease/amidase